MNRFYSAIVLGILCLHLTACTVSPTLPLQRRGLHGAILIWHTWQEPNVAILHDLFDAFMVSHPGVKIISEYVSAAEFDTKLVQQMAVGFGPDLLIGLETNQLRQLYKLGLLTKIAPTAFDEEILLQAALDALRIEDYFYAAPFAAYTEILYYNKNLVDQPAKTFDELLQEARIGKDVALPIDFYHAYWGVRTFGNDILDDEGNFQPDNGLEAWTSWLLAAHEENIILSPDYRELQRLFATGQAAYFVGNSIALPDFRASLGPDVVGVTLLPYQRMEGEELDSAKDQVDNRFFGAGGFLDLETMAISSMSAQKDLSFRVIEFFINRTHQRELAQYDLGQIPINQTVRFDPRFSPTQAILIRQSTDATILPLQYTNINTEIDSELFAVGTELYSQILEGVLQPTESSQYLQEDIRLLMEAKLP